MASGAPNDPAELPGEAVAAAAATPVATTPTARRLRLAGTPRGGEAPRADPERSRSPKGTFPSSPSAKRPRAEPRARPSPTPGTPAATHADPEVRALQRQVSILKSETGQQNEWADEMNSLGENHAKILNMHTAQIDQVRKLVADMKVKFEDVISQVISNDENVKRIIQDYDQNTKQIVEQNDHKIKTAMDTIHANMHRMENEAQQQHGCQNHFKDELTAIRVMVEGHSQAIDYQRHMITELNIRKGEGPPGITSKADIPSSRFVPEAEIRLGRGLEKLQQAFETLDIRTGVMEAAVKQIQDAMVKVDSFVFARTQPPPSSGKTFLGAESGKQDFDDGAGVAGEQPGVSERIRSAQEAAAWAKAQGREQGRDQPGFFDIHSDGPMAWKGPRRYVDEKLASLDCFKYDVNKKERWANSVRNDFIGRCADMKWILRWAEGQQHKKMFIAQLRAEADLAMLDVDVQEVVSQMWSWLHMNLHANDEVMIMFENIETLNGLEVWRQLMNKISIKTPEQRHRLHGAVHSPAKANKLDEVMICIDAWEDNMRRYVEAGGQRPADEDLRIITLGMLPNDLPYGFVSELRRVQPFDALGGGET